MSRTKRNLTASLAVTVLILVGFAFRGCESPPQGSGSSTAKVPIAVPAPMPVPTPAQSARPGQIYYHRDLELCKVLPGEGVITHLPKMAEEGLNGYQIQSDRLSPDAKQIAFGRAVIKKTASGFGTFPPDAIYLRNITTSDPAERLVMLEESEIRNFFWSPDGLWIAYTSWDEQHGIRNWVVDSKTKQVHEVKLPRRTIGGKEVALQIAAWTPDGKWFAASDGVLLYLVQMDQTGPTWSWSGRKRLTKEEQPILGGSCSFSPDGRNILFVVVEQGLRMSLRNCVVESGDERTLVEFGQFTDLSACWSPDGKRVAYSRARLDSSGKRAGMSEIYIIDMEGKGLETTPVLGEVHPPEIMRLRLVSWH